MSRLLDWITGILTAWTDGRESINHKIYMYDAVASHWKPQRKMAFALGSILIAASSIRGAYKFAWKHWKLLLGLLFSDATVLVSYIDTALQHASHWLADATQHFGLEINLKKTEVHQSAPHQEYHVPHISIRETGWKTAEQFTYLGCTISSDAEVYKEVDNRLDKANNAFGRLYQRVCPFLQMVIVSKILVYAELSFLLPSSMDHLWAPPTTWVIPLQLPCIILCLHWSEYVSNV